MQEEEGKDEKILAVPVIDPRYNEIQELGQIAPHFLREVEHFFHICEELESQRVETHGWGSRDAAERAINKTIAAAKKQFPTVNPQA